MKRIIYVLMAGMLYVSCNAQNDWIILFDGSNFDHWKGYGIEGMHPEWSVDGDAMKFTPSEKGGKDIMTKETFKNFELSLEWKISEGGNSGIFWGIFEDEKYEKIYQMAPEIQVLDNERHPDAKNNPRFHQAGALYDLVQPDLDVSNAAGYWNHLLLKVNHDSNWGVVTLNGVVIVEFRLHGPEWDALVENSKFKGWDGFGKYIDGHIGLQDHSDIVWYRNIKIRKLD
ncbi:MAG: glycosyl hydrolase [Bacteroidetes bacterium MedPE-SWsnd-G1]|nr:MAG: glycosyl hydrolase [Bacteroidetes bacterium MedPE-SWsnd-G1]